ncbi:MAG: penicillin-binding protein, partial [Alistipes sp.]|nr:penicillin-binding protein [Alistipes sp.]
IHNMGIRSYIDPVPALCLGTSESNVYELASAFSTFANEGVHTDPIFVTRIEDRQGNLIASFAPRTQDAISEQTAYTMLRMLEEVIRSGTGGRLNWNYGMQQAEVGGKTGTSQKNRDAWFVCVLPRLVTSVWVGGEDQAVHLLSRGEGSAIALPIVGEFFNRLFADPTVGVSKQDRFPQPAVMPSYDRFRSDIPKEGLQPDTIEEDEFFD